MKNKEIESKSLRFLSGSIALSIYLLLVGLLIFYFNYRTEKKPKHFVKKDEKRIQLASVKPPESIKIKSIITKQKIKKPVVTKKEKVVPPKKHTVIKEKIVKKVKIKKKDENKTKVKKTKIKPKIKKEPKKIVKIKKPKKIEKPKIKKTSDLFSSVKTSKKAVEPKKIEKNKIEVTEKPKSASSKINNSLKNQKESDSGVENAYLAKVQGLLETWPAQSDYAGEKAMVRLYVKPTGMFEFKVKSQSDNVDFNLGLIDFLMQLQRVGLGRHYAGKTYEFEVEFIAKE